MMRKLAITGIGKSRVKYVDELTRALMNSCKDEGINPINLGVSIEEYITMNEAMKSKSKKKSNGFLEGKKMNKILKKHY